MTPPDDAFPTLARLIAPVAVSQFLAQHWEQSHLHVPARDRGDGAHAHPVTLAEVDAILMDRPHVHPHVSLVDAVKAVELDEYVGDDDVIDPVRAVKRFAAGATVIVNRLDEWAPRVRELCGALESELGIHVQANLYLTPGGAQGFPIHYDHHDVIIVQCAGRKLWRLYDAPRPLPMRGERFDASVTKPGALTAEFVLDTGDVLYVPRGLMHDAVADGDEVSLHVTIGFHPVRWAEVLVEALAAAASDDLALRKGLPLGALVGAVPDAALADALRAHAQRVLDGVRWSRVRGRVEDEYLAGHKERLRGLLLDATTEVTDDTVLARREGARATVEATDDAATLVVQGRATRWPPHARAALDDALSRARFTPRDLADHLDARGRVTLARRLIAEGAVRIVR